VSTLIAQFFHLIAGTDEKMDSANIWATATAEVSPANAMTCVKPFTIPDKWIERQTPDWDPERHVRSVQQRGERHSPIRTSTSPRLTRTAM
jgi:hypothetical protein